jgi:hypothetical protein
VIHPIAECEHPLLCLLGPGVHKILGKNKLIYNKNYTRGFKGWGINERRKDNYKKQVWQVLINVLRTV